MHVVLRAQAAVGDGVGGLVAAGTLEERIDALQREVREREKDIAKATRERDHAANELANETGAGEEEKEGGTSSASSSSRVAASGGRTHRHVPAGHEAVFVPANPPSSRAAAIDAAVVAQREVSEQTYMSICLYVSLSLCLFLFVFVYPCVLNSSPNHQRV